MLSLEEEEEAGEKEQEQEWQQGRVETLCSQAADQKEEEEQAWVALLEN